MLRASNMTPEWAGPNSPKARRLPGRSLTPDQAVMAFRHEYVAPVLEPQNGKVAPDTPPFWSTWDSGWSARRRHR
jgi:hypothetical protein